jgi:uncharacterized protein (TIGR02271 family)
VGVPPSTPGRGIGLAGATSPTEPKENLMGVADQVKGVVEGAVGALNPLAKGDQNEPDAAAEAAERPATPATDTEEVRVARAEEELDVATVGRQAGSVGVSKTVHTETAQVEVPVRHEEVHIDRVPVDKPTYAASIGAEEIQVPLYAEETVVTKQPVVKEQVRISKAAHTDTDTVTADVRKEHLEVDDQSATS